MRGLAILMVMMGHFWLGARPETAMGRAFSGIVQSGWVGVDLFFVLSGFLITGILLDAKGSKGYFRNFYARRALRIFPLYYVFLFTWFFVLPAVFDIPPEAAYAADGMTQLWFWGYLSNFLSVFTSFKTPHGLNHFWSLAIEEQFYLIWPAVVLLVSNRTLRITCLMMIPAALLFRVWLISLEQGHTAAYVLLPARMETLAIGAWLASAMRDPTLRVWANAHTSKFLLGAAAVLIALNLRDLRMEGHELVMQTLGFPMLAILAASLIVIALRRNNQWYQRFFETRSLRFFGKYSYGMYVLHLPIVVMFEVLGFGVSTLPRIGPSDLFGAVMFSATAMMATIVAAYVSWHLFEKRFLKLKKHFPAQDREVSGENVALRRAS